MASRVIPLLLAAIIGWSGLASHEAVLLVGMPMQGEQDARQLAGPATVDDGSLTDHYLDDVPAQAAAEPATDPCTPQAATSPLLSSAGREAFPPWCGSVHASPDLATPQRPPARQRPPGAAALAALS